MKGIEAKYTAKHIAKMIKKFRKEHQNNRRFYETHKESSNNFTLDTAADKYAIANYVEKETNRLALEFRAFMIHNAFKKNRHFTSAEVQRYDFGDNYAEKIKNDLGEYSKYVNRKRLQDKAINFVRYNLLNDNEELQTFNKWIENA